MGLLRYRESHPGFLDAKRSENQERIAKVRAIFEAVDAAQGGSAGKIRKTGDEMIDFLEAKGINGLILQDLDPLSD